MSLPLALCAFIVADVSIELEAVWTVHIDQQDTNLELAQDGRSIWVSGEFTDRPGVLPNRRVEDGAKTGREMRNQGRLIRIHLYEDGAISVAGKHLIWWDMLLTIPATWQAQVGTCDSGAGR